MLLVRLYVHSRIPLMTPHDRRVAERPAYNWVGRTGSRCMRRIGGRRLPLLQQPIARMTPLQAIDCVQ